MLREIERKLLRKNAKRNSGSTSFVFYLLCMESRSSRFFAEPFFVAALLQTGRKDVTPVGQAAKRDPKWRLVRISVGSVGRTLKDQ